MGLRARGGIEADIRWRNGKLDKAEFRSATATKCNVRYGDERSEIDLPAGKTVSFGAGKP